MIEHFCDYDEIFLKSELQILIKKICLLIFSYIYIIYIEPNISKNIFI